MKARWVQIKSRDPLTQIDWPVWIGKSKSKKCNSKVDVKAKNIERHEEFDFAYFPTETKNEPTTIFI